METGAINKCINKSKKKILPKNPKLGTLGLDIVVDVKRQNIGETIIRLAYQRGSIASLLESFQAWCNMQEHQPIDVPSGSQSRVSPA